MKKWYEEETSDNSIIVSSRIRLARNLDKYPFPISISKEDGNRLKKEIKDSLINDRSFMANEFDYIEIDEKEDLEKLRMFERHLVSQNFLKSNKEKALLLEKDEKVSIMINEEDHIRLQCITLGANIDAVFEHANRIDDLIEETLEYAFDKELGYLTACPTNIGSGLRASFMVHIPMISNSHQLLNIVNMLTKFGMTLRGVYGEGTESMGSMYQISNQITLGKPEKEILSNLKKITNQIVDTENYLRNLQLQNNRLELEDKIYRSYGILKNARKISSQEAVSLLSDLRLGYQMSMINEKKPTQNIYNIIINTRSASIQERENKQLNTIERDIYRAEYLRSLF